MSRTTFRQTYRRPIPIPPGAQAKVGFPLGTASDILERAIYVHFGTAQIPERPFLDTALLNNQRRIARLLTDAAATVARGELDAEGALDRVALAVVGMVQREITELRNPPNAPSTIAAKGSSNPLIDTGEMRAAVRHTVESKPKG